MGSLIHLLAQSHLSIRPMKAILVLQHDATPSLCTLSPTSLWDVPSPSPRSEIRLRSGAHPLVFFSFFFCSPLTIAADRSLSLTGA
jgi:hypothetical protein